VAFPKVLVGSGLDSFEGKIIRDYWRVFLFYLMVESADLKTSLHCSSNSENIILNWFKNITIKEVFSELNFVKLFCLEFIN
jgi:hypothetical protein